MLKIRVGGRVDVQKIQRLVRSDEVLVGYPDGVTHPVFAGYRTTRSGRRGRRYQSTLLSNLQNADLARALHFGTSKIPARPWLYQSVQSVRQELRRKIREYRRRHVREGGREPSGEFSPNGIGAFLVGAVQEFVRGGFYKAAVPNAASTAARKGSDTPLIDTGFMINSTTYVTRTHLPRVAERPVEPQGGTP